MSTDGNPTGAGRSTKLILFDLNNTLFDHYHSLRSAVSAIQRSYAGLAHHELGKLVTAYNNALQEAYDKYLAQEITYDETEALKVRMFLTRLGHPEPTLEEVSKFRDIYKPAYRANRRATPGSVEALARLREHGYRLAIVSNGQSVDQAAKADYIGVLHLVDRLFSSEEAGSCKPDPLIFQFAVRVMGATPDTTVMVGDSADADIKGALDAGLTAVLYSPTARESVSFLFGQEVPVIRHMDELTEYLGVAKPSFF